jgi:uncharacterized protein (TIGR02271 family)
MILHKISDFDSDYHNTIGGKDFKKMGVYTQGTDEKIGTVSDVLVDEQGQFRYLIIDVGFWIFGKKVLLPVGRTRIDTGSDRVYALGLTKEQAEDLPEYHEDSSVDYGYEERVRDVYRTQPLEGSAPLEASAPLGTAAAVAKSRTREERRTNPIRNPYDRDTYNYNKDPDLYDTSKHGDQTIKLYEERLVANKQRRKAGEVTIGKHVETETQRVAVPVEKERIVIERVTPTDAGRAVTPGPNDFREGEVAHVELYEEVPEIHKEAVLREEVRVRKEVKQETVEAQETIRREELDIDTEGKGNRSAKRDLI